MIRKNKAGKNGTDDDQNVNTQTAENESGEHATTDPGNNDPYAWMKDFDCSPEQLANRGEPIGHMRFVAFQPADKEKTGLMLNFNMNDTFMAAMVQHLVNDERAFKTFKKMVDIAEMYKEFETGGIGSVLERVLGGFGRSNSPFQPGGMSFGERDEIEELLWNMGRRRRSSNPLADIMERMENGGRSSKRNPLSELLESLGERGGRGKIGIEAHVIGIKKRPGQSIGDAIREAMSESNAPDTGDPVGDMAAFMRKMTGGAGCDCSECREYRAQLERDKNKPGTDESENGTADKTE